METTFIDAATLPIPQGMSASFALCTQIWNGLVVPIEGGTHALSGALEGWMHTQYPRWVMAYFIIIALMQAYKGNHEGFMQAIRLGFLASVVYALCSNATTFDAYVTGLAHGTVASVSGAIANIFGGGGKAVTAGTFDQIGAKAFAVGSKVFAVIPWYSFKGLALCIPVILYWAVALGVIAIMFCMWMVSYVATDILLAFGPLFIGLYTIPFMRPTALGAFRVILAGELTQIMLVGTLAMFINILQTVLGSVVGLTGDAVNTANTPVAGQGDIAGSVYVLFFSAAACAIFLYVVYDIIKMARAIAGAPSAYVPDWGLISPSSVSSGGAAGSAASFPASEGAFAGSGGAPSRQYAFQRGLPSTVSI